MSGFLPPLLLTVCVFGGGWWLGSRTSIDHAPSSDSKTLASSSAAEASQSTSSLARRATLLQKTGKPSGDHLRHLLESGEFNGQDASDLVLKWAKLDPAGAWRWLEVSDRERLRANVSDKLFAEWLRSDPDAAPTALCRFKDPHWHMHADRVLSFLFQQDAELFRTLLPSLDVLTARNASLTQWLGEEAQTAAKLLSMPACRARDDFLREASIGWMQTDWKEAAAWARTLTEPLKSKMMEAMSSCSTIYSKDDRTENASLTPEYTAWMGEWLNNGASAESRRRLGPDYVRRLALTDPPGALAWAQENLQAGPLASAVSTVLKSLAAQDVSKSRAALEELPPGPLRQRVSFAAAGPPGVESIQWLLSHADPAAMDWAYVAGDWAHAQPEDFRKFISENPEGLPNRLVSGGVRILVSQNPEAALTWAAGLPSSRAASAALLVWSEDNLPAAAAWMKDHQDTALDIAAVQTLSNRYFHRSANDAVDWAASLPPGPARDASVTAIREQLSSASSMNPEVRAALEAKLGKP